MSFFDIFKSNKIKVQKYYNEVNKELNLPEIVASINAVDQSGELSSKFGQRKITSKISIPEGISPELVKLDQLQEQTANALNGLKGERRQELLAKYTECLMRMMEYQTKFGEDIKKKAPEIKGVGINQNSSLTKFLEDRNFKSSLLPDDLNKNQGFIIWPVTLLSKTTYIHKAQAQLIKLLVNCGWKLHVIIGDCGKELSWKRDFTENIRNILIPLGIEIENNTIAFLGDYYRQNESESNSQLLKVDSGNILSFFHRISERLNWSSFDNLIKKNYDELKRSEIDSRTVLNNIQPLLIWSLVTSIVKVTNTKTILIAGEDEKDQWKYITDYFTSNKLGLIYIHELKKEADKTMDQKDLKIESKDEMISKLNVGNMAKWLFTHFVEIPKFVTRQKPSFCKISENECALNESNCIKCLFGEKDNFNNPNFNKRLFVDYIWPLANPANN